MNARSMPSASAPIPKRFSLSLFLLLTVLSVFAASPEDSVVVTIQTSVGDLDIAVFDDRAPVTAANFLRLVAAEHLDGASFYRVVTYSNDNGSPRIEVVQGGLRSAAAPFPPIAHETTERTGILHKDGVVSMARGVPGTAASEFFICIGDHPALDYGGYRFPDRQGFAAFGKVIRGMDVVRKIHRGPTAEQGDSPYTRGQILVEPVTILRARRLR